MNRLLREECYGPGPRGSGGGGAAGGAGTSGESERTNCSVGVTCGNRCLQARASPPLELVPTPGKGWGVVAGTDVRAGTFIIEYVGEIIDADMATARLEEARTKGEHHFYMMEIDAMQMIDARFKSNLARFINHSCEPNAELQRWHVDGFTRIGIFALRDIRKGEEISYDYQVRCLGGGREQVLAVHRVHSHPATPTPHTSLCRRLRARTRGARAAPPRAAAC